MTSRKPSGKGSDKFATVGIIVYSRQYCTGLLEALTGKVGLIPVDLGDGGQDTLSRAAHLLPDAILMDLPEESLLELVQKLSLGTPRTQLIAMNRPETEGELLPLFEEGLTGFIQRDASSEKILATVRDVLRGEFRCPPRIVVALAHRLHAATHSGASPVGAPILTPRQAQIVHHLEKGLTNKQIAAKLGIEFSTVKNHVHRLLKKLAIHRREHVVGRPVPEPPRLGIIKGAGPENRDHHR